MKFLNLYNIILESRLDDYKLQLKDEQLAQNIFSINNPKKQKMIIKWIKNNSIKYPQQKELINKVYQIIQRKNLDFQKYNSPQQILDQYQQLSNKLQYNPDNEPCFTNKVKLNKGVVVYNVQNDIQGLKAVRRAVDFNWGKQANPWCLVTPPLQTKALKYWKRYDMIQKRICFQNNKLIAFCASDKKEILWWDRNDKPNQNIPIEGVEDDPNADKKIRQFLETIKQSKSSTDSNRLKEIYQNYKHEEKIIKNLIINVDTPEQVLLDIYNNSEFLNVVDKLNIIYNHPNCPIELLEKTKNSNKTATLAKKSTNENELRNIYQKYKDTNERKIILNIAQNPNTPKDILQKLFSSREHIIMEKVISNIKCPKDILLEIVKDFSKYSMGMIFRAFSNPNFPIDKLKEYYQKYYYEHNILSSIIANPNCPKELLYKPIQRYRYIEGLTKNPNTPKELLLNIFKDFHLSSYECIDLFAQNPNCPIEILQNLSKNHFYNIRSGVAKNPKCPLEILEKLSKDDDILVKISVATNPNCPENIIQKIINDKNININTQVAKYSNKPNILRILSKQNNFTILMNLAENPNTPTDILEELSKNKDKSIKKEALATLRSNFLNDEG